MNFRKLITYLTMGTAAAMPIATAQNPTILQGSYISNVFGNSNFVLNPNAQTNTANVTVSNATVSRSTTTPLVATSEFTITTSTSTGYADWALRTFDQGMKGQNCEARFTYRGFSVGTTTAQILQGANVVAQLALTASTDPRIASINFPCGDLSAVTKLRLQQASASLTGTNEIGGIYVGLATNMANVAQAENVVQAWRGGNQTIGSGGSPTTVVFNTEGLDAYGEMDTSTGIFTAKRAGNYLVNFQLGTDFVAWDVGEYMEATLFKNSTEIERNYQLLDATQSKRLWIQGQQTVALAVGDTLKVTVFHNRGANTDLIGQRDFTSFNISRFPSSSELVVTPERQNVFGSVTYRGPADVISLFSGAAASSTYTTYNDATWSGYRDFKNSRCEAPVSANDVGCQIKNLPVGSYKVTFSGLMYERMTAINDVICSYKIRETVTSSDVAYSTNRSFYVDGGVVWNGRTLVGTFRNTSVGDRNFVIQAAKTGDSSGTTGRCEIYVGTTGTDLSDFNIIIEPLDQPSNSALYVQGPVKAAETGAAIPASYVGETKQARASGCGTNATYSDGASITITPGVWQVTANGVLGASGTISEWLVFVGPQSGNVTTWRQSFYNDGWFSGITSGKLPTITPPIYVRYDGTNMYRFEDNTWKDAYATATGTLYAKFFRSATCIELYTSIVAQRIN